MKKFNGFERWFIKQAVENFIQQAEDDLIESERKGKNNLFAPGYFKMVGKELLIKVDELTLAKDLKNAMDYELMQASKNAEFNNKELN